MQKMTSYKIKSIDVTLISLPLGLDCGCALTHSDVAHAKMSDSQLRALDLWDCPKIESIDLRESAQEEIHLSVVGCPMLREIFLPEGARAYLHIDFDHEAPVINIIGGVAHIDVAWQSGRFEISTEPAEPWTFAVLGSLDDCQNAQTPETGNGLWALTQCINDKQIDLVLPDSIGSVLLSTSEGLEHCRVFSNRTTKLDIRDASDLEHLEVFGAGANISFTACPSLSCIDGPEEVQDQTKLALHHGSGASTGLRLNMPFTEVMIADSAIPRLAMLTASSLKLYRCYFLLRLNVPRGCDVECTSFTPPELIGIATTIFDESTLTHELDRIKAGDVNAWVVLRSLLPLASSEKLVPRVLKGLEAAMNLGVDIEEIWRTRLELYAQHRRVLQNKKIAKLSEQQLMLGTREWAWRMAVDLGHDGWRADWRIWNQANKASIKGVSKMVSVMADGVIESPQASAALLSHLLEQGAPNDVRLLTTVFERLTKNLDEGNEYTFKTAIKCAKSRHETPEISKLVKCAKDYICRSPNLETLIVVLEEWLRIEPIDTRVRLAQLIAKPLRKGTKKMSIVRFKELAQTLLLGGRLA